MEPTEEMSEETIFHELLEIENQAASDPAEISMIQSFGNPRDFRTMGKMDQETIFLLAAIYTKGKFNNSSLRQELVENMFLMNRSLGGFGSEQMVKVASSRNMNVIPAKKGFFGSLFNKTGSQE